MNQHPNDEKQAKEERVIRVITGLCGAVVIAITLVVLLRLAGAF